MQPPIALADAAELVGFFSYARDDDADFGHVLSDLRRRIQSELRAQLGRSHDSLRLWQDAEAIPSGTLWEREIDAAVSQAVFFIPIVTPRSIGSPFCAMEFDRFLRREKELERSDLVFPILFIDVDDLADERAWVERPVLRVIAQRQYADWREMRYDPDSVPARRNLALFCSQIARALKRRIAPPREAGGGGPGKAVVGGRRSNEEVDEGGSDRRPAPARTWPPAVTVVAVAALSAGMATLFGYVSFQTGAGEFIAKAQSGPIFALALIVLYRLHGRQDLTASLILTMSVTVSWIAGFQNHFALKGLFGIDVTKDVAVFTLYFIIMGLLGGIGTLAGALAMQPAPSMPMRGRLVPLTAVAVAAALAPGVYAMVLNVNQHLIMLLCYFSWQAAVMLSIFGLRREPLLATLRTSSPL